MGKARPRLRRLVDELVRSHPHLDDPEARILAGEITVNGIIQTNPETLVRGDAAIAIFADLKLRGEWKLDAALDAFLVDVRGRIALDLGAAAGGFTRALLRAGVRRVYAVDAGHGQLLGSLRLDPRVVNLERTNLGGLTRTLVPDPIDLVTIDLSYLSLTAAVPQLATVEFREDAEAIALVKPQFELAVARPPRDDALLSSAKAKARRAFEGHGWRVIGVIKSPVRGGRGAVEFLLHARR